MTSEFRKVKVTGGFHVVIVVIINVFLLSANTASVPFSTRAPRSHFQWTRTEKGYIYMFVFPD